MNREEQALFLTLYYLDDTSLAKACQVNKRFYQRVCQALWLQRLQQYKGIIQTFPAEVQNLSVKDQYLLLRDLETLKSLLRPLKYMTLTLLEIYQLYDLNLDRLGLTELPREIGRLVNLRSLSFVQNQLTELPREIGQLVNLRGLYVSWNQLTEIPREIGQLVNLRYLSVAHNQLTELPREIGQLVNLEMLFIDGNNLTEIPEEIRLLPNLEINVY